MFGYMFGKAFGLMFGGYGGAAAGGAGNDAEPGHRLTVLLVTTLRRYVGARRRRGR